jgi:hypothetical protein
VEFQHQRGVILAGIVGSRAYGLDTPKSDTDRLGVYAVPTEHFFGMYGPGQDPGMQSQVFHEPDVTYHEALKMCQLLVKGNPSVMELLWLPDELYEVRTSFGQELIRIRESFLSAKAVRRAYLGFATQQFERLCRHPDATDQAKRAKQGRHILRLLHQGRDLYRTGQLQVRLDDPGEYMAFGELVAHSPTIAKHTFAEIEESFDNSSSLLPDYPNFAEIESWLETVRWGHLGPKPNHLE